MLVPCNTWGGQGLLGVSIRFCSFEGAAENVWHVLVSQSLSLSLFPHPSLCISFSYSLCWLPLHSCIVMLTFAVSSSIHSLFWLTLSPVSMTHYDNLLFIQHRKSTPTPQQLKLDSSLTRTTSLALMPCLRKMTSSPLWRTITISRSASTCTTLIQTL